MRAARLTFVFFLFSLPAALHAQIGVYGKYDFNHYTFNDASPVTSFNLNGGGLGIYDDFLHLGPLRLGADLRADFEDASKFDYQSVLAGVRVSAKAPRIPLKPYVQGSIGEGGTRANGPFAAGISSAPSSHKLTYGIIGGVDWTIHKHIDFRVIEVSGAWQSGTTGGVSQAKESMVTVSTGIVFRF